VAISFDSCFFFFPFLQGATSSSLPRPGCCCDCERSEDRAAAAGLHQQRERRAPSASTALCTGCTWLRSEVVVAAAPSMCSSCRRVHCAVIKPAGPPRPLPLVPQTGREANPAGRTPCAGPSAAHARPLFCCQPHRCRCASDLGGREKTVTTGTKAATGRGWLATEAERQKGKDHSNDIC
jgi:hypothetical protein